MFSSRCYFPFPRFCACIKRNDAKNKDISSGEWIVYKVKDPIPHDWKSRCNLSVGFTPHFFFSVYWWCLPFCLTSKSIALFLSLICSWLWSPPFLTGHVLRVVLRVSQNSVVVVLCFSSKQFWKVWAVRPRSQRTNGFLNWPGCIKN